MRLNYGIAQILVNQIVDLLGANVHVADAEGMIVASAERRRVGAFHPSAAWAVSRGEPVDLPIPGERARAWQKEGICLPLSYDGQRVGAIIVHDSLERCRASSRVVQALAELIIHQNAVLEKLPQEKELRDKFIYDLLHNPIVDEREVLTQAQILGMDLAVPRAVILVDATEFILEGNHDLSEPVSVERQLRIRRNNHRVIQSIVRFFTLPTDNICGYIGGGRVAVLKAIDPRSMSAWAPDDGLRPGSWEGISALRRAAEALLAVLKRDIGASLSLAIGRYHPGLAGLSRSYRDAKAAIELGSRLVGGDRVLSLESLGIAAFIGQADQRTKADLAKHLLQPLEDEPDALPTLQAFFERDCRPSEGAAVLGIHRNTLGYRLDKIQSLTGLDPRRLDDALQLRLAVLLRDLDE